MNPDEAAVLLACAAAFDNRQPSMGAAQGWAVALHDIPLDDDTKAAVAVYYSTPPKDPNTRLWILPHHIRSLRSQIRSARLENFAYEGDPDETPAEFLARYRGQVHAIASGAIPAPTGRLMLEGGPANSVAELLSGQMTTLDDNGDPQPPTRPAETVQRTHTGPLGITCPDCFAPIGRPCRTRLRRKTCNPHPARRRAAAGEPIRLTTEAEINARRHQAANRLDPITEEQQ